MSAALRFSYALAAWREDARPIPEHVIERAAADNGLRLRARSEGRNRYPVNRRDHCRTLALALGLPADPPNGWSGTSIQAVHAALRFADCEVRAGRKADGRPRSV